ncbi:MAG: YbaB/EbfC family nucleoid-associated protein [Proteobacteria bacterium]|nr:YbaB/EbfC family nucleoid-associated protein [Pseudomonadota bacterium]
MDENSLLTEIKNSILSMQQKMQATYNRLGETKVSGKSRDGYVEIIMTATYQFEDIKINPRAFGDAAGKFSQKEFEYRLREAWKDLSEKIQKTTQSKTIELLQTMDIPEDIKNIALEEEGATGTGEGG